MSRGFFITGTDTDVGKTVVAAWAVLHLSGAYWKPVQAGIEGETDSQTVLRLTGAPVHPEAYVLREPLSPHESARREGITIEMTRFQLPQSDKPIIVEGAGGLLVPLKDDALVTDLIARLALPVLLVARSTLGTINHTLLSLEALRRRGTAIAGIVLNGPISAHNRAAIERYGRAKIIAEIPVLQPLDTEALLAVKPMTDLGILLKGCA